MKTKQLLINTKQGNKLRKINMEMLNVYFMVYVILINHGEIWIISYIDPFHPFAI